jgi:hypothetical protein
LLKYSERTELNGCPCTFSPEDGNRSSFQNTVSFWNILSVGEVQKLTNPKCITPSSESSRKIYPDYRFAGTALCCCAFIPGTSTKNLFCNIIFDINNHKCEICFNCCITENISECINSILLIERPITGFPFM